MLQIGNTLISLDLFDENFVCDVKVCKGICCVEGDSGAPLTQEEADTISEILPDIKPFLSESGLRAIETLGPHTVDSDGDIVTPLVNNKECAYVVFEKGIAKCGIEKAFEANKISFRKPISCHLYPVRVTKYSGNDALNYHEWDICKAASKKGKKLGVPLYRFLAEPLKREYGESWYSELEVASFDLLKYRKEMEEGNKSNK